MNFRRKIAVSLLLCTALCGVAFAQVVHIPDPNLRTAVAEAIDADPDRITRVDMRELKRIDAVYKEIENLEGLQHAHNLRLLDLDGNRISDLTPLANLTSLEELGLDRNRVSDISPLNGLINLRVLTIDENRISDLTPLANLTSLKALLLSGNRVSDLTPLTNLRNLDKLILNGNDITDISSLGRLTNLRFLKMPYNGISDLTPLANLTNLEELVLNGNRISDISPLAGLTNLKVLKIEDNLIIDHSILDHLSIETLYYDQTCEFPPEPLAPRLENRSFPSIFGPFKYASKYDLIVVGIGLYYDYFFNADGKWQLRVKGSVTKAVNERDELLAHNPNTITIAEIRMVNEGGGYPHPDSPDWVWVHDRQGNVYYDKERRVINFTHPLVQDMIVQQAVAISKCGLYDGIFLDWWSEFYNVLGEDEHHNSFFDNATEQQARDTIMRRIRSNVRPDFLVMGNMNRGIAPRNAPHINGSFMETITPSDHDAETAELLFSEIADSLQWLESNLREPRINALEGLKLPFEPPDSPANVRWMRAFTTLSLTLSDGYVYFIKPGHGELWYEFWNTDLGQPIGAKSQTYNNVEGLYIREFTNGWAIHNRSGQPQVITLPAEGESVVSGLVDTEHVLLNLDGDIILRAKTPNPADVNGDGIVNILDLILVAQAMGTDKPEADVNGDNVVNIFDLVFVANHF